MIDESNHAMIQRIAELYDVPIELIDYGTCYLPVSRVSIKDVTFPELSTGPVSTD